MASASYEIRVITANRLIDGEVVYLTREGWDTDINRADTGHDDAAVKVLLDRAWADEKQCRIISPYWIGVTRRDGGFVPVTWREVIRTHGPGVAVIDGVIPHAQGKSGFARPAPSPWVGDTDGDLDESGPHIADRRAARRSPSHIKKGHIKKGHIKKGPTIKGPTIKEPR